MKKAINTYEALRKDIMYELMFDFKNENDFFTHYSSTQKNNSSYGNLEKPNPEKFNLARDSFKQILKQNEASLNAKRKKRRKVANATWITVSVIIALLCGLLIIGRTSLEVTAADIIPISLAFIIFPAALLDFILETWISRTTADTNSEEHRNYEAFRKELLAYETQEWQKRNKSVA